MPTDLPADYLSIGLTPPTSRLRPGCCLPRPLNAFQQLRRILSLGYGSLIKAPQRLIPVTDFSHLTLGQ